MNLDQLEFIWDKLSLAGFLYLRTYRLKSLMAKNGFSYSKLINFFIIKNCWRSENDFKKKKK